jgi:hypothetical protein
VRINDRLVVQMIDDHNIVFVDDSLGDEQQISIASIPDLARKLASIAEAGRERSMLLSPNGIRISSPEAPGVSFALGYFWGVATERGNNR